MCMEDDSFLERLPKLDDLPSDPDARYAELETILGEFRPRIDAANTKTYEAGMDITMLMLQFFPERKVRYQMTKEWPFTIDQNGKATVLGGTLSIKAANDELAEAYHEELLEHISAKFPDHMQHCRDLETLFKLHEPFAKDMVRRYAQLHAIVENRDVHKTLVGIAKKPYYNLLWIDMKSGERTLQWTNGDPGALSASDTQEHLAQVNKKYNIYILDHQSQFITSEELLRSATFLMDEKYSALQGEAQRIKEELDAFGTSGFGRLGKNSN